MNLYSHRSQAATEYLMTYGWAFLIIAIVAAILISLGVFSPSPSSTVTGFSTFGSAAASVSKVNGLVLTLTNENPNIITLTNLSLSSASGMKIGKVAVFAKLGSYSSNNQIVDIYNDGVSIDNLTIPPGQSFTIIISNVSAYSSYSTQATITYYENGIPQSSTGTISGTPVSSLLVPSNYFVTITNTQTVATPNPFQQMINVSSSSPVWPYINTNQTSAFGQNVEFIYLNGTVIPSWLESYSSTHAIWWIKIGSIPANSAITIFMKIAPKSTNLFNGVTVGEAPQLSPTYGEYNNIANVMNNGLLYQFYQVNGGGMQSQNSVYEAQLTPNSSFAYGSLTATAGPTLYHTPVSGYVSDVDGTNENNVILNYQYAYSGGVSFPNPPISNPQYVIMKAIGWVEVNSPTTFYVLTDDGYGVGYSNSGGDLIPWLGGTSNPNNIINEWIAQGATEYSGTISSPGVYRIELDYTNQGGPGYDAFWSNNAVTYYSPTYPPNGVMPSVSIG